MDVIGMIRRSAGGKKYTITRVASDGYYDQTTNLGEFMPGGETTVEIVGSLQPVDAQDLETLDDGADRTLERFRFYSFPELLNNDTKRMRKGDLVAVGCSDSFRVEKVAHWPNHSLAIIAKVNTDAN